MATNVSASLADVNSTDVNIKFNASRISALMHGSMKNIVFPKHIYLTKDFVRTEKIKSLFIPWKKEDEMITFKRVSSVRHIRGIFWDSLVIETAGGTNALEIHGLRKADSAILVKTLNENI